MFSDEPLSPHPELTVLVERDQADRNKNLSRSQCKAGVVQVLRPAAQFVTHLSAPCRILARGQDGHVKRRGWRAGPEAWLCEEGLP